jgi:hypothetical protein
MSAAQPAEFVKCVPQMAGSPLSLTILKPLLDNLYPVVDIGMGVLLFRRNGELGEKVREVKYFPRFCNRARASETERNKKA